MSVESGPEAETQEALPLPDCGQRISVETPRHAEKLWTYMIGYKPGGYVVIEKPPGGDAVEGPLALKDGDSLVIRFMKDGSIYGFRTPVLGSLSFPYKLLFVAYPVEVVKHSLRSSPRLQTHLPCFGLVGGREFSRAFIRDFSATGCQLRVPLDALEDADEELVDDPDAEAIADGELETAAADADAPSTADGDGDADDAADGDEAEKDTAPEAAAGDAEPDVHEEAPVDDATASADAAEASADDAEESADIDEPPDPNSLTLYVHLPGEEEARVADGRVLEWQTMDRYHLLRIRFDEPQTDVFEQLCLYTTQFR